MLFKTHLTFSIVIYFLLLEIFNVPNKFLFFCFVILAAVFVDLDSKNSFLGKKIYFRPFQFLFKHRGALHSLFFGIFLSLCVSYFSAWAGFGFFAGYFSHLFLDFLTREGVPVFWPLSSKKFGFGLLSDGLVEKILFVLFLLLDFYFVGRIFL